MARLVATRTESKCLVCRSPRRSDCDQWIARLGETDGNGRTVTWEILCTEVMPLLLSRASIAQSSLKRHRANHCRLVEDAAVDEPLANDWEDDPEIAALAAELDSIFSDPRGGGSRVLAIQARIWAWQTRKKLLAGERVETTADQAARAADKLLAHEKTHEQAQLLGALAGAVGAFTTKALGSHDDESAELEAGEIIEEAEVEPSEEP